jgi:hypothetical protein
MVSQISVLLQNIGFGDYSSRPEDIYSARTKFDPQAVSMQPSTLLKSVELEGCHSDVSN